MPKFGEESPKEVGIGCGDAQVINETQTSVPASPGQS